MELTDDRDLRYITTQDKVDRYIAISGILPVIFIELRELYKRNPAESLSEKKQSTINELIKEALIVLEDQPEFRLLDKEMVNSESDVSDVIFEFAKYNAALDRYRERHYRNIDGWFRWVTPEFVKVLGGDDDGDAWDR